MQIEDRYTAGETFTGLFKQRKHLGSSQDVSAVQMTVSIDGLFQVSEQLWRVLNFIDDYRRRISLQELKPGFLGFLCDMRKIKRNITIAGQSVLQHRGFTGLAGPCDKERRTIACKFSNGGDYVSAVSHMISLTL